MSYVHATYNRETKQAGFKTNRFSHYVVDANGKGTIDVTVTVHTASRRGYTFSQWEIVPSLITLLNANTAQTTFVMPVGDVTLKVTCTKSSFGVTATSFAPDDACTRAQIVTMLHRLLGE